MNRILIIDEFATIDPAKFDALARSANAGVVFLDYKTEGENDMLNPRILAAALIAGLVTASPLARSPETVAESMGEFSPTRPRYHAPRRSNVAQAKRAKTKRRNIAKHPGCNGHHRLRR